MIKYVVLSKMKKTLSTPFICLAFFNVSHDAKSQQKAKPFIFLAFFNGLVKSGIPFDTNTLNCYSPNSANSRAVGVLTVVYTWLEIRRYDTIRFFLQAQRGPKAPKGSRMEK